MYLPRFRKKALPNAAADAPSSTREESEAKSLVGDFLDSFEQLRDLLGDSGDDFDLAQTMSSVLKVADQLNLDLDLVSRPRARTDLSFLDPLPEDNEDDVTPVPASKRGARNPRRAGLRLGSCLR